MNRVAESVCPSLSTEAPLRLSLLGSALILGVRTSVLAQNVSRAAFQIWNSVAPIKLYIRIIFWLISEREPEQRADEGFQCMQLTITLFLLKPRWVVGFEMAHSKSRDPSVLRWRWGRTAVSENHVSSGNLDQLWLGAWQQKGSLLIFVSVGEKCRWI